VEVVGECDPEVSLISCCLCRETLWKMLALDLKVKLDCNQHRGLFRASIFHVCHETCLVVSLEAFEIYPTSWTFRHASDLVPTILLSDGRFEWYIDCADNVSIILFILKGASILTFLELDLSHSKTSTIRRISP